MPLRSACAASLARIIYRTTPLPPIQELLLPAVLHIHVDQALVAECQGAEATTLVIFNLRDHLRGHYPGLRVHLVPCTEQAFVSFILGPKGQEERQLTS